MQDDRVRLGRHPERGRHDRDVIDAILDEGFVCHLGFVVDGHPTVVPTAYGRDGDRVVVHGSVASRAMLGPTLDVCLTVTIVDDLVLARSAFHHSINYRSVMVLGEARRVADEDARMRALEVITNNVVADRWDHVRPPSRRELAATAVLELDLTTASAKVRTGGVKDDDGDIGGPHWAGLVPVALVAGSPRPDPLLSPGTSVPRHVADLVQAIGTWSVDQ